MSGSRRLYLGDARDVLRTIRPEVDAVITDPPFGILAQFGSQRTRGGYADGTLKGTRRLQFDWDGPDTRQMVQEVLALALDYCREVASCFVFCGFDTAEAYALPARDLAFTVKPACWVKEHPPPAGNRNRWPSAFELAYYGYRGPAYFGDRDPARANVFTADALRNGQPGKTGHPTQKPLGLMKRLVESLVPPGGLVLDPFMGSGTTGQACDETGRRFIGIEINPAYFTMAEQRLGGKKGQR